LEEKLKLFLEHVSQAKPIDMNILTELIREAPPLPPQYRMCQRPESEGIRFWLEHIDNDFNGIDSPEIPKTMPL
jgi:hypothetical protein